jgi:hypothetical protein
MMNQNTVEANDEISIAELIQKVKSIWRYLLSQWKTIFIVGILGAVIGFFYAWLQPVKYVSKLTFVLEESKSGSGLASIAGQFGIDLGGAAGGGIFSGDNILLFLKSESLIRETLFSAYDEKSKYTLADRYAEVNELKKAWSKNEKIGIIEFSKYTNVNLPRKEDSLLQTITEDIIKNELSISKPDKKASFVEVKAVMRDEWLSKLFSERLVKIATQRYILSKTKTKAANVQKLQDKADSLVAVLNNRTFTAASSQQRLVDINPALRTAPIAAEISSRDKTIAATLYAEVIKNLELSRTLLNQETPVIEMVDQSSLPLEKEKVGKLKSLLIGGILAGFLTVFFLLASRWLHSQLKDTAQP